MKSRSTYESLSRAMRDVHLFCDSTKLDGDIASRVGHTNDNHSLVPEAIGSDQEPSAPYAEALNA